MDSLPETISNFLNFGDEAVAVSVFVDKFCQDEHIRSFVRHFLQCIEKEDKENIVICFQYASLLQRHRQVRKRMFDLFLQHPSTICKLYKLVTGVLKAAQNLKDLTFVFGAIPMFFNGLHVHLFQEDENIPRLLEQLDFVEQYPSMVYYLVTAGVEVMKFWMDEKDDAFAINMFEFFQGLLDVLVYLCLKRKDVHRQLCSNTSSYVKIYHTWSSLLYMQYCLIQPSSKQSQDFFYDDRMFLLLVCSHPLYAKFIHRDPNSLLFTKPKFLLASLNLLKAALLFVQNDVFTPPPTRSNKNETDLLNQTELPADPKEYALLVYRLSIFRHFVLMWETGRPHLFGVLDTLSKVPHPKTAQLLAMFLRSLPFPKSADYWKVFLTQLEMKFETQRLLYASFCSGCKTKASYESAQLLKKTKDRQALVDMYEESKLDPEVFVPVVLQACSKCKLVLYCSKKCQVDHWSTHKHVCQTTRNDPLETKDRSAP